MSEDAPIVESPERSHGHPSTPEEIFKWLSSRERPGAQREFVVTGLGPGGSYTCYAPSPTFSMRYAFEGGKPVRKTVESCMNDPALVELRGRVIRSLCPDGITGLLTADLSFMEYAAAILRINYDLSDEDLSLLLGSGQDWHQDMSRHLMGGDGLMEQLAQLAPRMIATFQPPSPAAPPDLAETPSPPRKGIRGYIRSILHRS